MGKKTFISFITEIELLTFDKLSVKEKEIIKALISDCTVVGLNEFIKKRTINLRLQYHLKIPDAIISATADFLAMPAHYCR